MVHPCWFFSCGHVSKRGVPSECWAYLGGLFSELKVTLKVRERHSKSGPQTQDELENRPGRVGGREE